MNKISIQEIIKSIGRVSADRESFLNQFKIDKSQQVEISGTTKSYNYGELCEIALKLVLGQQGTKEQKSQADIIINGVGYDIKAIDKYASARKGHNTDTTTTLIIANYKNYKGVYQINNKDIEYTPSGKIQRAETLAKAKLNKDLTSQLMGC